MKKIRKYVFLFLIYVMTSPLIVHADLNYVGCGSAEGIPEPLVQMTRMIYTFLVVITPLVLIAFSIITMIKALKEQNADEVLKAKDKLIKKFIAAGIILLIGVITRFVMLQVVSNDSDQITVLSCMKCFLYNADCHESDTGNDVKRGYYHTEPDSTFINDTKSNRENYKPSNTTPSNSNNNNNDGSNTPNVDEKYHYHQGDSEWADVNLCGSGPMRSNGCNITSIAMVLSILKDQRITPVTLNNRQNEISTCKAGQRPQMIMDFAKLYGFTPVSISKSNTSAVNDMFNKIASGGYAATVRIAPNTGTYSTNNGHYVTIVKAKEENGKKKVLIWDPATTRSSRDNAWIDLDSMLSYLNSEHSFILVGNGTIPNSNNNNSNNNNNNNNQNQTGRGLWVAHQKNSKDRTKAAINAGFWGIEVDVHQSGSTFKLYHDNYHGYNLSEFLDDCRSAGVTPVLDIKSISSSKDLVNAIKSKGMLSSTIIQTGSTSTVKNLYNADSSVRIWFLNSASGISLRKSEIQSVKDKLEGVNMLATAVNKSTIDTVHGMGLKICAFSYIDGMYPSRGRSAATLKSWGADYLMANAIGK